MPYQPTGRPPGRPKAAPKHAAPSTDAPLVLCPCGCGAFTEAPLEAIRQDTTRSNVPFELAPCCPACNPDGWPEGFTGYGCEHGIWARRI